MRAGDANKESSFLRIVLALLLIAAIILNGFALVFADSGSFETASSGSAEKKEESQVPAGDTTTTGADDSSGSGESSGEQSSGDSRDLSEEELAKRKEIYTFVAIIAAAAILVGIRDRKRRR